MELKYDGTKFKPTVSDIQEWFVILNEQVFGEKLTGFTHIHISKLRKHHALFHYWPEEETDETIVEMSYSFKDLKTFVDILTHEMIHKFQRQFGEPVGHGPTFWAWKDHFKLRGLTLKRAFD